MLKGNSAQADDTVAQPSAPLGTLSFGAINRKLKEWDSTINSWWPVSYQAMGRWMLEEGEANAFVHGAPVVSRRLTRRRTAVDVLCSWLPCYVETRRGPSVLRAGET